MTLPSRRLNRFLSRVSRRLQLRWALGMPETFQINPTNACNIRCAYCPKTSHPTDNHHMSREVYQKVRSQILPIARRIQLQGLGEPLMSPWFYPLLQEASERQIQVSFVTNATLVDQDSVRQIVLSGAQVAISLDGATAETHERSRPGAKFDKMIQAFALFSEEKKKQPQTGFSLSINTVVNSYNVEELDAILDIASQYQVSTVALINPGTGERTDDLALEAIGRHPQLLQAHLPALQAKSQALGIQLLHPLLSIAEVAEPAEPSESTGAEVKTDRLFPGQCMDPWNMAYVDVDGWIRPCCRAVWVGMGNLLEDDFKTIWNNKHYRNLRKSVNSNNPPSFCRDCCFSTGINNGDERWVLKLKERGIELPPPPKIGVNSQ